MNMVYVSTYWYLSQFLSSVSYNFPSTGLLPPWLNLFLCTTSQPFHGGSHWGAAVMALHYSSALPHGRGPQKMTKNQSSLRHSCYGWHLTKHTSSRETWSKRCVALPPMNSASWICSRSLSIRRPWNSSRKGWGSKSVPRGRGELSIVFAAMSNAAAKRNWAPYPLCNKACLEKKNQTS